MQAVYLAGNILRLKRVKETAIQKFSENFLDWTLKRKYIIYHLNNLKNQAKSYMGGSRANPNTLMTCNLTALVKEKQIIYLNMS